MEEDDIREAEEARQLETSNDFAGFGSTEADATRRGGLMDLLKTSGETMGVKMIKNLRIYYRNTIFKFIISNNA